MIILLKELLILFSFPLSSPHLLSVSLLPPSISVPQSHPQLCHGWTWMWEEKSDWSYSDNRINSSHWMSTLNVSLPNSFLIAIQLSAVRMAHKCSWTTRRHNTCINTIPYVPQIHINIFWIYYKYNTTTWDRRGPADANSSLNTLKVRTTVY